MIIYSFFDEHSGNATFTTDEMGILCANINTKHLSQCL